MSYTWVIPAHVFNINLYVNEKCYVSEFITTKPHICALVVPPNTIIILINLLMYITILVFFTFREKQIIMLSERVTPIVV